MKDFRGVEIKGGDRVAIISKGGLITRRVLVANGFVSWVRPAGDENPRGKSSGLISVSSRVAVLMRADDTLPEVSVG